MPPPEPGKNKHQTRGFGPAIVIISFLLILGIVTIIAGSSIFLLGRDGSGPLAFLATDTYTPKVLASAVPSEKSEAEVAPETSEKDLNTLTLTPNPNSNSSVTPPPTNPIVRVPSQTSSSVQGPKRNPSFEEKPYFSLVIDNSASNGSGYDIYVTIGSERNFQVESGSYKQIPGAYNGKYLVTARAYDPNKSKDVFHCTVYLEIIDETVWSIPYPLNSLCNSIPSSEVSTSNTPTPTSNAKSYYPLIIDNTAARNDGYDIYITIGSERNFLIASGLYKQIPGVYNGKYLVTARAYDPQITKDIFYCTGYLEINDVTLWSIPYPLNSLCDSFPSSKIPIPTAPSSTSNAKFYYPLIIDNTSGGDDGYDIYVSIGSEINFIVESGTNKKLPGSFNGEYLVELKAIDSTGSKNSVHCTEYIDFTDVVTLSIPFPIENLCATFP